MRKLLSALSALTFTFSAASSVAACNDTVKRFTTPTIADKIKNMIIAELAKEGAGPDGVEYKFGDLYNNTSTLTTLAERLINQEISNYFYSTGEQNWATWAKAPKINDINMDKVFKNSVMSLAVNKLYKEYLSSFATGTYLEYSMMDKNNRLIYDPSSAAKSLPWRLAGVQYYQYDSNNNLVPLPVLNQDSESRKEVKADLTNAGSSAANLANFKKQLAYEFHDYLLYTEVPAVIDNIIGQTFMRNTMFSEAAIPDSGQLKNHIYISKMNALFSNMMNWTTTTVGADMTTNFDMVWEYQIKLSDIGNDVGSINTAIQAASTGNAATLNGAGWTPTNFKTFVDDHLAKYNNVSIKDYNEDGSDPVFGIPHFKGFVAYDVSGNIVNGFSGGDYANQLKTYHQKAGFIVNSQTGSNFNYNFNGSKSQYTTFAYVLPVYVPDILNDATMNFGKTGSTTHATNIELKNYNNPVAPVDLSWNGVLDGQQGRSVKYLYDINKGAKAATWGTYANDGTTKMFDGDGNFTTGVDTTNYQLLQAAENAYAQSSTIQDLAKTRFYSLAFNYSKDNLYSQNLYNDIGKYIEEKPKN